jgi:hypothetical protein
MRASNLLPLGAATAAALLLAWGCSVGLDDVTYDRVASTASTAVGGGEGDVTTSSQGTGGQGGAGGGSGGTNAGGAGQGGTSASASGGGAGDCALSDEFDDLATLDCWTLRHEVEGWPAEYSLLDIDLTTPGHLTIIPNHTSGIWFDEVAPFLYKEVTGNFLVVASVAARGLADSSGPPTQDYNGCGLLVRAPIDLAMPTNTDENWVKYEMAYRDSVLGAGSLAARTASSQSAHLVPYSYDGITIGEVAICRVGDTYRLYRRNAVAVTWVLEHTRASGQDGVPLLPATVQVGPFAAAYEAGSADVRAEIDYVRFLADPPAGEADCIQGLAEIAP